MNEATKRKITLGYSIALIILAAIFTFVTILPVVTFKANEVKYGKEYYSGTFTSNMDMPDELELGLISVIDFIRHFSDAQTVARVQAGNETVEEDERARLAEKLDEDKSFANSVLLFYAFGGLVDDGESEDSTSLETSKLGTDTLPLTMTILGVIFLICLIGVGFVFPIIIIIKFIIFLIKSLKHIKDDSDTDVDNRMDKFSFTAYTAMMVMFYMLYALVSRGVGMGLAIKGAMIVFIVVCALRAVKAIIFAGQDRTLVIIKQAITAVSIVAVVLLMFNFIGVDLINELDDVVVDMSQKQYLAELDKLADSDMEAHQITDAAQKAVASSNAVNTSIIVTVALSGAIMIVAAAGNSVERFANKKGKTKTGELVPYKAMVVLSVFLLIIAIVPTVFAVGSEEARDEAFEAGQFKVWYTEYQEEGTKLNIEYEFAKEFKEVGDEELAELREELKTAEGEKAEQIAQQIEDGEKMLAEADEIIGEIEARAKRPTTCIILTVIFLIAEYAYLIVPKILMKNKKEEEPAVEPAAE